MREDSRQMLKISQKTEDARGAMSELAQPAGRAGLEAPKAGPAGVLRPGDRGPELGADESPRAWDAQAGDATSIPGPRKPDPNAWLGGLAEDPHDLRPAHRALPLRGATAVLEGGLLTFEFTLLTALHAVRLVLRHVTPSPRGGPCVRGRPTSRPQAQIVPTSGQISSTGLTAGQSRVAGLRKTAASRGGTGRARVRPSPCSGSPPRLPAGCSRWARRAGCRTC